MLQIDFAALTNEGSEPVEFAKPFSKNDLKTAINDYLDSISDIIKDLNDSQLIFQPVDETANDPDAKTTAEISMAWSIAHLVLHVTASLEEGAAVSSLLARGVAIGGRFRYEPDWRDVTTSKQVNHRLAESRRMCLAYLDTWPDEPHLDTYRIYPPDSRHANTKMNAPASLLFSLKHLSGHLDQFRNTVEQAKKATV
jgi:hypothetical protein